ncbi:MAG: recombinase family protein, partial [Clostridia bacterium]
MVRVFDYKRRNGEYIGSFAPYGYLKDPADKHALIVDEEAAEVVRKIFTMFLEGMAKNAIAWYFNDAGLICPSLYKKQKVQKYNSPRGDGSALWATCTIDGILK